MLERRAVLELRASGRKLEGLAAPFDIPTPIGGGIVETIRAGAFQATLAGEADILALVDHDQGKLLARRKNGSLRLQETRAGLEFSLDIPNTTLGADILAMAEHRLIGGASFAFSVREGGERWQGRRRELRAVDLCEVSIVSAYPAYHGTEVHARARMPGRLCSAVRWLETV